MNIMDKSHTEYFKNALTDSKSRTAFLYALLVSGTDIILLECPEQYEGRRQVDYKSFRNWCDNDNTFPFELTFLEFNITEDGLRTREFNEKYHANARPEMEMIFKITESGYAKLKMFMLLEEGK
jgi:hypothetical protein